MLINESSHLPWKLVWLHKEQLLYVAVQKLDCRVEKQQRWPRVPSFCLMTGWYSIKALVSSVNHLTGLSCPSDLHTLTGYHTVPC